MANTTKRKAPAKRKAKSQVEVKDSKTDEIVSNSAEETIDEPVVQEEAENSTAEEKKCRWQFFCKTSTVIYLNDNKIKLDAGWNYIALDDYGATKEEFMEAINNDDILFPSEIPY